MIIEEPTREEILAQLRREPQSAHELNMTLQRPATRRRAAEVRHILERMERAGLVQRSKDGPRQPWIWEAVV